MSRSRRLAYCLPPLLWMALILSLSTEMASAQETARVLDPLFHWLLPRATPIQIDVLHALTRKAGHVTEYGIFAALWYRAFRRGLLWSPRASVAGALLAALALASLDEAHQSVLPMRTASAGDVAIDMAGAVAAVAVAWVGWRVAVDAAAGTLLWIAAAGGAAILVVNLLTGVPSGALWITAPAAALALLARRSWRKRLRA